MNPAPRTAPAIPTRMAGVFKTLTPISDGLGDPDAEAVYERFAKTVGNRTDQAACSSTLPVLGTNPRRRLITTARAWKSSISSTADSRPRRANQRTQLRPDERAEPVPAGPMPRFNIVHVTRARIGCWKHPFG